jgi:chromosome segregation ATPase
LTEKESCLQEIRADKRDQELGLDVELDKAKEECTKLRQQLESLTVELQEAEQRYETKYKSMQGNEAILILAKEAAEAEISRRIAEQDRLQQDKEDADKSLAAAEEAMKDLQRQVSTAQIAQQEGIDQERQKREEIVIHLASVSRQVAELRESLEHAENRNSQLEQDLVVAQETLVSAQSQKAQLQHEVDTAHQQRLRLESRLADLEESISALQQSKASLIAECEASRAKLVEETKELAGMHAALEERQSTIESMHNTSRASEKALEDVQRELEQKRAQNQKL